MATDVPPAPDEHLAAAALYQHVIEMSDGIEMLLRQSCCQAAIPPLRSSYEALLGLEYIMASDYHSRSLAWLCGFAHQKLSFYKSVDPSTAHGIAFWQQHLGKLLSNQAIPKEIATNIQHLEGLLAEPHLAPIEAEWQRLLTAKQKVYWYRLFGGPSSIRGLAERLGQVQTYDVLYRRWSRVSHAQELPHIGRTSQGNAVFRALRNPETMREIADLAITFQVKATRLMLAHFRHGEDLSSWYSADMMPLLQKLRSLKIVVTPIAS
jgi:hypothetical protein